MPVSVRGPQRARRRSPRAAHTGEIVMKIHSGKPSAEKLAPAIDAWIDLGRSLLRSFLPPSLPERGCHCGLPRGLVVEGTTDKFPSYGVSIEAGNQSPGRLVVNDASCVEPVLGVRGSSKSIPRTRLSVKPRCDAPGSLLDSPKGPGLGWISGEGGPYARRPISPSSGRPAPTARWPSDLCCG